MPKLSYDIAEQIRAEYGQGLLSQSDLAAQYNVCKRTIACVLNGLLYARPASGSTRRRLTFAQAEEIRQRRKAGESRDDLAREYAVGMDTISGICSGWLYADAQEPFDSYARRRADRRRPGDHSQPEQQDGLLTAREAADRLGLDRSGAYRLIREGKLAPVRLPTGGVRVREEDVAQLKR